MSFINDGKGRGFKASVSSSNRLNVSAKSNPRAYYLSRDEENCFSIGTEYTASDGDIVFYIKNTSSSKEMVLTDCKDFYQLLVNYFFWCCFFCRYK